MIDDNEKVCLSISQYGTVSRTESEQDSDQYGRPQTSLRPAPSDGFLARDSTKHYALDPMSYSVMNILIVESLERFCFYGISYTLTLYLTGVYSQASVDANGARFFASNDPGYTSIEAASFVSMSTAMAFTTPFIGAVLADKVLGDYYTIVLGLLVFYLPGLLLLVLTTTGRQQFSDDDEYYQFPRQRMLSIALLFLWPAGTGIIKSVVNVFGARQFHPILQSSLIESFYIYFYAAINVGALAGISILPVVASRINITVAYVIPLVLLIVGIVLFLSATSRYVVHSPRPSAPFNVIPTIQNERYETYGQADHQQLLSNPKETMKRKMSDIFLHDEADALDDYPPVVSSSKVQDLGQSSLFTSFRISLLIVPFAIAYSQMPTTFIVQGTVMAKAGPFGSIDAATMNSVDTLSVLFFGYMVSNYVYPAMQQYYGIAKVPTTYKFAIGSFFGALSILWALIVELMIRNHYQNQTHQAESLSPRISVLWQTPSYILIGAGEIFAVSSAYEVAFTTASSQNKVMSSAINIFCVGGIPNLFCMLLFHICRDWFRNSINGSMNITRVDEYVTAHVSHYFVVLLVILVFGIMINVYPPICNYVDGVEKQNRNFKPSVELSSTSESKIAVGVIHDPEAILNSRAQFEDTGTTDRRI
jgi:proton-dependent oligopeptide transporter, POT family